MSRTTLIIRNDIKRRLKAPMATILFLVIPLAMTALIGMIFDPGAGDETKLPPIKLLLVDNDKGLASKFLIGAFDQKEVKEMFQVTLVEEAAGEKLMKKGKASAMLVIPEHFSDDLAEQKASALEVVKNPSEEFLPGVAEEFASDHGRRLVRHRPGVRRRAQGHQERQQAGTRGHLHRRR